MLVRKKKKKKGDHLPIKSLNHLVPVQLACWRLHQPNPIQPHKYTFRFKLTVSPK